MDSIVEHEIPFVHGVLEIISNDVPENILYSAVPLDWFLSTH